MTKRTLVGAEGRLFPAQSWQHGWHLSLQADASGYRCRPLKRLDRLEDYLTVEAVIRGPFPEPVDPSTLDLPAETADKFVPIETSQPSIGCNLTWTDVEAVRDAILRASLNPNAGIPRGSVGWSGRSVFHGTSLTAAEDIYGNGIDLGKSHGGYFGHAFYVADNIDLAISNYAEFAGEDEEPVVLEFVVEDASKILDLRNGLDFDRYRGSPVPPLLGRQDLPAKAAWNGIDGVYDRSVGGLAIFRPEILSGVVRLHRPREAAAPAI